MTARCAPSRQAQFGVDLHPGVGDPGREQRRKVARSTGGYYSFVVEVVGHVQPFGGRVEVGQDLHRVAELNRHANRPNVNDFPALAGSPAGSDNGTCITKDRRNDVVPLQPGTQGQVHAARKTLAVLPPNASLTVFQSASGSRRRPSTAARSAGVEHGPRHRSAHRRRRPGIPRAPVPRGRRRPCSTPVTASTTSQTPVMCCPGSRSLCR